MTKKNLIVSVIRVCAVSAFAYASYCTGFGRGLGEAVSHYRAAEALGCCASDVDIKFEPHSIFGHLTSRAFDKASKVR